MTGPRQKGALIPARRNERPRELRAFEDEVHAHSLLVSVGSQGSFTEKGNRAGASVVLLLQIAMPLNAPVLLSFGASVLGH